MYSSSWLEACFQAYSFHTLILPLSRLVPIQAVQRLEHCGFNVIAFCLPRQTEHSTRIMELEENLCIKRQILSVVKIMMCVCIICDAPHLIKTARNCWSNYFSHKQSRALWVRCQFSQQEYKTYWYQLNV